MRHTKVLVAAAGILALAVVLPSTANAQARRRPVPQAAAPRAVPRGQARVAPYRPYYYRPYYSYYGPYRYSYYGPYRSGLSVGLFFGYPYGYYGYGYYGYYGYPYGPYAYGYAVPPYGYSYPAYGAVGVRAYGGVRIDVPQRDAQVYVDGYFSGVVDQYDGTFQQLNLEAGPHHIEVRAPGFETIVFDVNVEPGQTITYRASMRPAQP